jgi:hypothetical protein
MAKVVNNIVPNDLLDDPVVDGSQTSLDDGASLARLADGDNSIVMPDLESSFVAGRPENNSMSTLVNTTSEDDAMILSLDDLFPDENGEVVIVTEDGLPINLIASLPLDQSGVAETHVTAAGIDVSGLNYHTFESGLTVYFEADSLVQITDPTTEG